MAFDLTIDTPAAPGAVLAAIRRTGPEWRGSQLPRELRVQGLFGVDAVVEGRELVLTFRGPGVLAYSGWKPSIRGVVSATGSGGSTVRAEAGVFQPAIRYAAPVVFTVAATVMGGVAGLAVGVFATAAIVGYYRWLHVTLKATDPAAAFLVARLESIVRGAAGTDAAPAGSARERNAR